MPVLMSPFHSDNHSQGACSTSPVLHSDTQPITSTTQWYTAKSPVLHSDTQPSHQYYTVIHSQVTSDTQPSHQYYTVIHSQGVCSTSPVLHSDTAHSGTIPPHCWPQTSPAQLSPEHSQHSFNGQPHRNNTQHIGSDINHHGYLLTYCLCLFFFSHPPHFSPKKDNQT